MGRQLGFTVLKIKLTPISYFYVLKRRVHGFRGVGPQPAQIDHEIQLQGHTARKRANHNQTSN
jgi:hypothetical protein